MYRNQPETRYKKKLPAHGWWLAACCSLPLFVLSLLPATGYLLPTAYAVTDPISVPNNRFGIHIISPSIDESSPAAQLVNSNGGDWGYVTVLVESKNRSHDLWQNFFNDLRRRHLIPLVRLATQPEGNYWKLPYEGEEEAWADFLDRLVWPTKNRYVIIYNEPNQGQEWAGRVDAKSYAEVLDKTITALKKKSPDFFILNAGFDASAPQKPPLYTDEYTYLKQMEEAVPGIFNKLDGWVSHSYPNPGFAGSPDASGKGTVRTWVWEMEVLSRLGLEKDLPVFITETGWKHAEGVDFDKSLPNAETVGKYLRTAFQYAWNSPRVVAVTPFLLNYQGAPFDHFSFKKITGEPQNLKILGASYPEYYPHFESLMNLNKITGQPVQDHLGTRVSGSLYPSLVVGEDYLIPFIFKNTGQSIWNEGEQVTLKAVQDQQGLTIAPAQLTKEQKIEPGGDAVFYLPVKATKAGRYKISLSLFRGGRSFEQSPLDYAVEVKSPVILKVVGSFGWRKSAAGNFTLSIDSDITRTKIPVALDEAGESPEIEARYLLPDYPFNFTLSRLFYHPRTIKVAVQSGMNVLDFGKLDPDYAAAFFNPLEFWRILPFNN